MSFEFKLVLYIVCFILFWALFIVFYKEIEEDNKKAGLHIGLFAAVLTGIGLLAGFAYFLFPDEINGLFHHNETSYVVFKDPALDKAVHKALNIQENEPILLSTASSIEVTVLDLSKNTEPITDLKGLSSFINLKELWIPHSGITNISELKNLNRLTILHLERNSIKNLSPLKNLTNLEKLDLEGNKAADISPLKKLTKLNMLDVRNNGVKDIGVVKKLTKLKQLYIGYNKIKNISPIENLPELYYLSMGHNEVEDLRVLNSLPKLSKLSICYNPINTQFVIMGLTGLKHLRISEDQFTKEQIKELKKKISDLAIGD